MLLFFSAVFMLLTLFATERYLSYLQKTLRQVIQKLSRAMNHGLDILQPFPIKYTHQASGMPTELLVSLNEVLMRSKTEILDLRTQQHQLWTLNTFFASYVQLQQQYLNLSSLILSRLGLGIRILDSQGAILFENETFHRLSTPSPDAIENLIQVAIRHVSDSQEENAYIYRRPNRVIQVQVHPLNVMSQDIEAQQGTLVVLEDITLQEEMKQRSLDIERWTAIAKMSAQVSHEIRNPLNAIGLNLEMVTEDLESMQDLPPNVMKLMASTLTQTERLKSLSDQYLRLHRIFDGEGCFDANKVVNDVVATLSPMAQQNGIQINLSISSQQCILQGDIQALYALTQNVLQNAIDELQNGGQIWIRTCIRPNQQFILKIRDSGRGIPAAKRHDIFQPFYTTKKEGTGLGLAIAKYALHHLSGQLRIKSGHPDSQRGTSA